MEDILQVVRESPVDLALVIVFSAAALEYILPPLPADSVVLAGALLVVAGVAPFEVVYGVAVAGGAAGAFAHYQLGHVLADDAGHLRHHLGFAERWLGADALPRFFAAFRKHGYVVIALNRAFPGVRAVTFLAAGAARLPVLKVMAAGLVSNAAWTLLILSVGVEVGDDLEKIQRTFSVYQNAIYLVGGLGLALFVAIKVWQRHRRARAQPRPRPPHRRDRPLTPARDDAESSERE